MDTTGKNGFNKASYRTLCVNRTLTISLLVSQLHYVLISSRNWRQEKYREQLNPFGAVFPSRWVESRYIWYSGSKSGSWSCSRNTWLPSLKHDCSKLQSSAPGPHRLTLEDEWVAQSLPWSSPLSAIMQNSFVSDFMVQVKESKQEHTTM